MPARARRADRNGVHGAGRSPLQWGRARAGTEGPCSARRRRTLTVLQWGRARAGTEGGRVWDRLLWWATASMGPCPRGHGGDAVPVDFVAMVFRFNGAVPARARRGGEEASIRRSIPSFNGAVPARARRDEARRPRPARPPSFNGAVPARARRGEPRSLRGKLLLVLQWGRARAGTEGADRQVLGGKAQIRGFANAATIQTWEYPKPSRKSRKFLSIRARAAKRFCAALHLSRRNVKEKVLERAGSFITRHNTAGRSECSSGRWRK